MACEQLLKNMLVNASLSTTMSDLVHIHRLVVASPADVKAERDTVPLIVDELNRTVCADRGLRVEVTRWETDSYPGLDPDGPQGLIDRVLKIEECDVLVGIFWKRFGSPTKDAASGTAHEFALAYEAWKQKRRPQVMVYFNQKPYAPKSEAETDQWGQVLKFQKAFPEEGLWWGYRGATRFRDLIRTHLTSYIRDRFPLENQRLFASPPAATSAQSSRPDYFTMQSELICEHQRAFVGRTYAKEAFDKFLAFNNRGYFIIRGGPGQGKTAFLCSIVNRESYIHHFISRTGGRTDVRLILRSLVSQLQRLANVQGAIPESLPDLTKAFEELLLASTVHGQKIVIVIDALDELPDNSYESAPYLLPEPLPEGVYFVVTSRPGERLERLRGRLFAVPNELYELGPLDISEIREILRSAKPDATSTDIERIAEASQGNPLYVRAVAHQLRTNPSYNLQVLPPSIEGFFRDATNSLAAGNSVLHSVLGLLSVARAPLSVRQLSQIMNIGQRQIVEDGINPIRQFLLEVDGAYTFYHNRFHEFVTHTSLYPDELPLAHRKIADWLQLPENTHSEYRLASLAYHLFECGDGETLTRVINEQFLVEKVLRLGYAALEDLEFWTRILLSAGDPALVGRCVSLLDVLRQTAGGDILSDAKRVVQPSRPGPESFRAQLIEPAVPTFPGLEIYVGILPKTEVAADFYEVVSTGPRLAVAIGDAPSVGFKSAFAARFVGNLFHTIAARQATLSPGKLLEQVNSTIKGYPYFERISMQCADVDPQNGIVRIANAGHPDPVHYSSRRRKCDILPLHGELLDDPFQTAEPSELFEEYVLSVEPGDVLVFVTDGLTEDHILKGDAFGYRFTTIVESSCEMGARAIGQAILDNWRDHPRDEDAGDDVSIVIITVSPSMLDKTKSNYFPGSTH